MMNENQNATLPANQRLSDSPLMLPGTWIEKLFQKFEDLYGTKWAAQYGDFPRERVKQTWAEALAGFEDKPECIGEAIQSQLNSPFPPTLPEFLRNCRNAATRRGTVRRMALDSPPVAPEVQAQRLETLKEFGRKFGKREYGPGEELDTQGVGV